MSDRATLSTTPTTSRERIVAHALTQFSARGYNGVSMSEIAVASGTTKAALYYHFADKEALFLEAVAARTDLLAIALEEIMAARGDLESMLRDMARFMLDDGLTAYRRLHADLMEIIPPGRRNDLMARVDALMAALVSRLRAEQAKGHLRADLDVEVTVPLFFAMVGGQIRRRVQRDQHPDDHEQLARVIVELWLHGAATPRSATPR